MKSEDCKRSIRQLVTHSAITLALVLSAGPASADLLCRYGEPIRDPASSHIQGCRYALSTWTSMGFNAVSSTLLPTGAGDCVVDLDQADHNTVQNGGALPVSTSGILEPRILRHCLENPGFERYSKGACVDEFWYSAINYWPMDEGLGSTLTDKGAWGNGMIFGATRAPGWMEGGLSFDGVNDFVQIPDSIDLDIGTRDFSIEFWIKTGQKTGVRPILDKRVSGPYRGWHVFLYQGKVGLQLADGNYSNYITTVGIANNEWRHVAITVDRDKAVRFYVDSIKVTERNPSSRQGSLSNSSPLRIGRRTVGGGYWSGTIDELAIHDGALDKSTIEALGNPNNRAKCYAW